MGIAHEALQQPSPTVLEWFKLADRLEIIGAKRHTFDEIALLCHSGRLDEAETKVALLEATRRTGKN